LILFKSSITARRMDDTFSSGEPLTPTAQQKLEEDRSVSRMQRMFPEKLRDMCTMHLAIILDLSDGKLDDVMQEEEVKASRTWSNMFRGGKDKEKTTQHLFGSPLTETGVFLMMPLIGFLRKEENIKKEGLFRKAGNGRKMKLLKEQLLTQGSDLQIDPEQFGSHDVACVLKEFLRELPEPLLTHRHMEAHRQIRGLGLHASKNNKMVDSLRYQHKKVCAIQYLMRLLPVPAQKMVRHLMKLLHRVAHEPHTKMTADTLGTIFAPICFLPRKASASDVCDIVTEVEPSVAFMIENGNSLFEVPREMTTDVINFWKEMEKCATTPANCENNENASMKRWPSGPIVNTTVCYADRSAAHAEDTASNTQQELAQLFAHVASLPDTPHNIRLKKQIQKGQSTPTPGSGKRSKSIGASIKKRLPSLGRSKKYSAEFSVLSSGGSYRSETYRVDDCLNFVHTPVMSDLLNSPSTSRPTSSSRESRPRQKRTLLHSKKNEHCTPPKQSRLNCSNINEDTENTPCNNETRETVAQVVVRNTENTLPRLNNIENLPALPSPIFKVKSTFERNHHSASPSRSQHKITKHLPTCSLGLCKCSMSVNRLDNNNVPATENNNKPSLVKSVSAQTVSSSNQQSCEPLPLTPVSVSDSCLPVTAKQVMSEASRALIMHTPPEKENTQQILRANGTPIMKRAMLTLTASTFETAL